MPIIAHEHYCAICDDKWICQKIACRWPDSYPCKRCIEANMSKQSVDQNTLALNARLLAERAALRTELGRAQAELQAVRGDLAKASSVLTEIDNHNIEIEVENRQLRAECERLRCLYEQDHAGHETLVEAARLWAALEHQRCIPGIDPLCPTCEALDAAVERLATTRANE